MFQRFKNFRKLRKWYVVKLKLVDARLYFVSIFLSGIFYKPRDTDEDDEEEEASED